MTTQATETLPRAAILHLDGSYIQTITTAKQLDNAKCDARRWADKGQEVILRYVSAEQVKAIDAVIAEREERILAPARKRRDDTEKEFSGARGCNAEWRSYDLMRVAQKTYLDACSETYAFNAFQVA